MGSLLVYWLAVPLLVLACAWGIGWLLVVAVAGMSGLRASRRMAAVAVLSGFAVFTFAGSLLYAWSATAPLFAAVAMFASAAGWFLLLVANRGRRLVFSGSSAASWVAGIAAMALSGAAVLISGEATFAGYKKLDDTATWLAFADHLPAYGRATEVLAPSAYEAALAVNLGEGYPFGSVVPLAFASQLTGLDPAWMFQPLLSLWCVVLAVAMREVVLRTGHGTWSATAIAVVASQAALLYGYGLWGGVKEMAAAATIVTAYVLATRSGPESNVGPVSTAGLVGATGALTGILGAAGIVWLVPAFAAMVFQRRREGRARHASATTIAAGLAAVAAIASQGWRFLPPMARSPFDDDAFGNLSGRIDPWQAIGVWPAAGDFRSGADLPVIAGVIIAVAAVAWLYAVWSFTGRRDRDGTGLLALIAGVPLAALVIAVAVSPWVGAKALAIASPVVLVGALTGAVRFTARMRITGIFACVAIVFGVAWSDVMAVQGASLAPRAELEELEVIGERFSGRGPTFVGFDNPYATRHFLRRLNPESATDIRRRVLATRRGIEVGEGVDVAPGMLAPGALDSYNLVVVRRNAENPADTGFRTVFTTGSFEVWERQVVPAAGAGRQTPGAARTMSAAG